MKVVEINSVCYGSTGKIMIEISKFGSLDNEFFVCYPKGRHNRKKISDNSILFGNQLSEDFHIFLGRVTGLQGCFSLIATKRLLDRIKKINPDIIHLHNLHNSYINVPLLFHYIKKNKVSVVWTLHDCWAFTGHCPHYENIKCDKWKKNCKGCKEYKEYPKTYVNHSRWMYYLKKKWFTKVDKMLIITPSVWLENQVNQSFLRIYPTKVINNAVDISTFKPVKSDFKKRYGIENKKIVLGVAFEWGYKKGLDIFIELAKKLDENFQIVLVGTNEIIEKCLPENIISIRKTNNVTDLVEIYSAADVFVNPTREEVFGLVNIEALACGTPVITFDSGGSPECIDETCGIIIEKDNHMKMCEAIVEVATKKIFTEKACIEYAHKFSTDKQYSKYIEVYENVYKM